MIYYATWSNVQAWSWYFFSSTTVALAPMLSTARTHSHATVNWLNHQPSGRARRRCFAVVTLDFNTGSTGRRDPLFKFSPNRANSQKYTFYGCINHFSSIFLFLETRQNKRYLSQSIEASRICSENGSHRDTLKPFKNIFNIFTYRPRIIGLCRETQIVQQSKFKILWY
jgi:hypothetical protein